MALGAADAADPVDVHDPHRVRTRLTSHCERGRREEREQEVPGDAIARRADEDERGAGLVGEQQQRERDERARRDEEADRGERVERSTCTRGSTTRRPTSRLVPAPGRPLVSNTFGCQRSFAESAASFAFSPGWSPIHVNARFS